MSDPASKPGLTLRSLVAIGLAVLLSAIFLQADVVLLATGSFSGEHAVPFPAVAVLAGLVLLAVGVRRVTRRHLLTRQELICVLFACLIAMPLMTQGFWHRFLSITATLPRHANTFSQMDAYSSKLWPHGPDLLAAGFADANRDRATVEGQIDWTDAPVGEDRTAPAVVLVGQVDQPAVVRLHVDLQSEDGPRAVGGEPFLVSVLARPGASPEFALPAGSRYTCLLRADDGTSTEVFSSSAAGEKTFVHPNGFRRVGAGAVPLPVGTGESVTIEFRLDGPGRLVLADPVLTSVRALEGAYDGFQIVTRAEYDALPAGERAGLVVRPDRLWSLEGIGFLLTGYIPWSQWLQPVAAWTALLLLLLLCSLALTVLLRRQWMDNERYTMPLARIPMSLLGARSLRPEQQPADETVHLPPVLGNATMWVGLILAGVWTLLRAWQFYTPSMPSLAVSVPLQPYLNSPALGEAFNGVTFTVSAVFVSIAMFMELNILLSIVVGFFAYRLLYVLGETTGWSSYTGYPYPTEQQIGAYVAYAAVILLMTWRYWRALFKAVLRWDRSAWQGEMLSYPAALALLVGGFGGLLLWARWTGVSVSGMAVLGGFLLMVALVAARLRCECGVPFSYLGPYNATVVLVLLGGASTLGAEAFLLSIVVSFFVGATPFFMIPGAQLELAEIGRRFEIRGRHLLMTAVLGILGGMLIGGWVFLSNSYGLGGATLRYNWAYETKPWAYSEFNAEMARVGPAGGDGGETLGPRLWGYVGAGSATVAVAVVRKLFAGFWFHPIGVLLGSSWLASMSWGSCLTAWLIRTVTLRFGGAATVRNRLQPFFIGVFLGTLAAHILLMLHAAWLNAQGVEQVFRWSVTNLP